MDTRLDTTPEGDISQADHKLTNSGEQQLASTLNIVIFVGLALVALIPRIVLATQLDMVTDEVVYILGGKLYLPLLAHLSIGASGWMYNYEHPPFVKLLIGLVVLLNAALGHPLGELLAARIPSMLMGTLLVVAIYWLGRAPFGRVVALLAALCLAVSPWLVYFSALAYLDMTMTALITIAYLLLWHAIRRPWLYLVVALLVGLGADSKYTAVLAVPGIALFTLYYFLAIRPRLPVEQRPSIPWRWWLAAIVLSLLAFVAFDPAIWPDPYHLLIHSFRYEWDHSINGHLTFIAGQYSLHVPHWAILYIILVKISAFVTVPAAFFAIFAVVQLVRFHLRVPGVQATEAARLSFVVIWLIAILAMFSLLNIVVGTHYHLPMAAPVAVAGACGLATLLRYRRGQLFASAPQQATTLASSQSAFTGSALRINPRAAIVVAMLAIALVGPHLFGLVTVHDAEGYTSEFFHDENAALQVAYPGYRDALQWLAAHTNGSAHVGLVALPGTLSSGSDGVSWYNYNSDLQSLAHFQLAEAHPTDKTFAYDYLVWPMHLVQRGYAIPEPWRSHVLHIVMGGNTIYCYILSRTPTTSSP